MCYLPLGSKTLAQIDGTHAEAVHGETALHQTVWHGQQSLQLYRFSEAKHVQKAVRSLRPHQYLPELQQADQELFCLLL